MSRDAEQSLRRLQIDEVTQNGEQQNGVPVPPQQPARGEPSEDVASVTSQQSRARKNRRGGRKKKGKLVPQPPVPETVPETQVPWSETTGRLDPVGAPEAAQGLPNGGAVNGKEGAPLDVDVASQASTGTRGAQRRGGRKKKSKQQQADGVRIPWSEEMEMLDPVAEPEEQKLTNGGDVKREGVAQGPRDMDGASVASQGSTRGYRRGGRKNKSRVQQTSERQSAQIPWAEQMELFDPLMEQGAQKSPSDGVNKGEMPQGRRDMDTASVASQGSTRGYRRGGRKSKSRMQQASESHIPWSERTGRLGPVRLPEEKEPASDELQEERRESPDRREVKQEKKQKEKQKENGASAAPSSFQTGIQAFNIKRAENSTGGRPFGISVDRGDGEKSKKKKKKKKSKTDGDATDEESEEEEEQKKKPFSIRLDLNLEVEIFLKAAIKGDVTITFLE